MMARIRTVKPELFKHEDLFDLEQETGLPIRIAFVGLFTCADREGRFKWKPRTLKTDVLPHDEVDFSRVLDALATRDFVRKYVIEGVEYGLITAFAKHQVINNREAESDLPAPTESAFKSVTLTREARVDDASGTPLVHAQAEGKGKEGKGTETPLGASAPGETVIEQREDVLEAIEQQLAENLTEPTPVPRREKPADEDFERAWAIYPKRDGGNPKHEALKSWNARRKEGVSAETMIAGVERYAAHMKARGKLGTEYVMQAVRFFGPSKQYDEPWPVAGQSSGSSMMRPNGQDYSSNQSAMQRTIERHGLPADGDLNF